jgi:hypothetical protein
MLGQGFLGSTWLGGWWQTAKKVARFTTPDHRIVEPQQDARIINNELQIRIEDVTCIQ